MFTRTFTNVLLSYAKFPAVAVLGPRQSGKTTVVKQTFTNHKYTSFEDPNTRNLAITDPIGFLRIHENPHGIIIDEFQHVPDILSYIQLEVDTKKRPGYFILTGSHNFLMNQAITQSLAGRVGILTLLPLSIAELSHNNILKSSPNEAMLHGGYPRIYAENLTPQELYPSYIQTYVERDVRQLINIGDLGAFQRFLKLCAGRVGQLLNLSALASESGISVTTARRWISILEASYIIFLLQPHFNNFNKRLIKSPKLYFYDTGLACSLLGINSINTLSAIPFRGSLFECFIIADIYKQFYNIGERPPVYFWRDLNKRLEVDCIIEQANNLLPIEIKSSETIASDFFDSLKQWGNLAQVESQKRYLVYGGQLEQERKHANIIGWKAVGNIVNQIKEKLP